MPEAKLLSVSDSVSIEADKNSDELEVSSAVGIFEYGNEDSEIREKACLLDVQFNGERALVLDVGTPGGVCLLAENLFRPVLFAPFSGVFEAQGP